MSRELAEPIFRAYLEALRRRHRADSTLASNHQALSKLDLWLCEQGLTAAELTALECECYYEQRLDGSAISTLHHDLSVIRAACRYAIRHDWLERDPTVDVRLPRLPDEEPATYSNNELRAIHAGLREPRGERIFYLFAFAGLRACEAARLTWPDVDFSHEQLKLNGKAGKFRLVPLHPVLSELLRDHRPRCHPDHRYVIPNRYGERLSTRAWVTVVRRLVDQAEITTSEPAHTFRKTVATVMHEQGVPTAVIDKIMGWAPRTVRERHYLRVADQAMRDGILTLYRNDPIVPNQLAPCLTIHQQPEPAPPAWLEREYAQLERLEHALHKRAAEQTHASRSAPTGA